MKQLLLSTALLITATSASAFTCKNTVTMVDGEWSYTSSQCGTQAPASAEVLEMITYVANNPPKDAQEEVIATEEVIVTEEVTVDEPVELTRLEQLKIKEAKFLKRGAKLWKRYDTQLDTLGWRHPKTQKTFKKAKTNAKKRKKIQRKIAKLSN